MSFFKFKMTRENEIWTGELTANYIPKGEAIAFADSRGFDLDFDEYGAYYPDEYDNKFMGIIIAWEYLHAEEILELLVSCHNESLK